MNTIAIEPFAAEVENKISNTQSVWRPATVVGINLGTNDARFVVVREADGDVWPEYADFVRRPESSGAP